MPGLLACILQIFGLLMVSMSRVRSLFQFRCLRRTCFLVVLLQHRTLHWIQWCLSIPMAPALTSQQPTTHLSGSLQQIFTRGYILALPPIQTHLPCLHITSHQVCHIKINNYYYNTQNNSTDIWMKIHVELPLTESHTLMLLLLVMFARNWICPCLYSFK